MEPSANQPPNFELPPPLPAEGLAPDSPESTPAIPERGPQAGSAPPPLSPPVSAQPSVSDPLQPVAQAVSLDATTRPIGTALPSAASDTDLIEKEWVEKAKEIVEQTRSDPHLQNNEINKFKADYMKKRYNKDIKVTNE